MDFVGVHYIVDDKPVFLRVIALYSSNKSLYELSVFFFEVAKKKAVALSSSLTPKACPYPDVLRGEDNDVEEDVLRSHE